MSVSQRLAVLALLHPPGDAAALSTSPSAIAAATDLWGHVERPDCVALLLTQLQTLYGDARAAGDLQLALRCLDRIAAIAKVI